MIRTVRTMEPLPPEDRRQLRAIVRRRDRADADLDVKLAELVERGLASAAAAELGISRQAVHKRTRARQSGSPDPDEAPVEGES